MAHWKYFSKISGYCGNKKNKQTKQQKKKQKKKKQTTKLLFITIRKNDTHPD